VLHNSTLQKNQFIFAMEGGDGYSSFIITQNNKLISLGKFSYNRFIRIEYGWNQSDLKAIQSFLDLCIKKIDDPKIIVPILTGNPDLWDAIYK